MGASAGRVLLIPKGDWNARTTYTGLDLVRHNGAAWVCKNTCTNIEPTSANTNYWQMMARDGDGVTADTAMSDTSTNAVQNKVVKSYVDNSIAGIADMTGATATQNGTHGLVPAPQIGDEKKVLLGDGTWGAIDDKFSLSDHDTATSGTSFTDAEDGNMLVTDWTNNLMNPTLETTTKNGVTITNNGDGTYTLNGTATADTFFDIFIIKGVENIKKLKGLKYICIPNGTDAKAIVTRIAVLKNNSWITGIAPNTVIGSYDANTMIIQFIVFNGKSVSNIVNKPMLTTDLNATYDDFVPYGGYEIQSCGKNLLNPTLKTCEKNGVTITNNGDGTYTLNGTVNENSILTFVTRDSSRNFIKKFIGKKLKFIYAINEAEQLGKSYMCVGQSLSEDWVAWGAQINNGESKTISDKIFGITCDLHIFAGDIFNNVLIKPMLTTDLNATYDDFEPYTGETITVTNDTESPAFGLKSHKGLTHIISPGNVKCVYPTNESGKGVLDAMYNNELSKLKNAILTYKTKDEYDAAVANDKIPDGATVIKDYDD